MATKMLLTPAVTGALLFALTASPDRFREPLLAHLKQYVSTINISRLITTLKWLVAVGLVRDVNTWLSEWAQNNFRLQSEKHRYDWPTEIALITGATGGFGSLMSKELAAKGVTIIAVDLRDDLPADMKSNPKIHYYQCDITEKQNVTDLANRVREEHGDPSILINNAGISGDGNIAEQTQDSLEKIFKINIISHYYTVQEFLPAMARNKKGHVVTIASLASFITPPGLVPYANTKVAAHGFHEGARHEARVFYNAPEIKFSVVHPTFAATPMTAAYTSDLEKAKAKIIKPEMVSNAVVKQILSGRGKQIIIAPGTSALVYLRSLPYWISNAGLQAADSGMRKSLDRMALKKAQ
ncbi:Dehydrogenase RED2 [Fulvia fulva]|uniref:Short-chain dehydrogenase/reductase 3 n=1 Tax=Passalora fulva TaxID=5499 RepID=A0A9Q8PID7_PASFU|nr:Dehydrogenase RED2 [Fulvia fulva]KAK4626085.1 Dehydrogenase RED2 [Fulvia fulva]KAK4627731.1 Dehydrogenase RED2 [Fulvia fulva]UJO23076.1 Dehydrogenase RED2 [Fulvia fulva]WPV13445.1 Dehydrogenase RED2 [Fulvia fulva]WPV29341.1 Dehydrogenase RED2 [Fulvia fulva]